VLLANWPDRLTVVAVVVVRVVIAGIEVEVPGVVRIVRIERTGPIVAVTAHIVEVRIVTITGGRKETTEISYYGSHLILTDQRDTMM